MATWTSLGFQARKPPWIRRTIPSRATRSKRGLPFATKALLLIVAALQTIQPAGAAPIVELPSNATWIVTAPRADRLASATHDFLNSAGESSYRLRPGTVERDLVRYTGLSLFNASRLKSAGVDVRGQWSLFALEGRTYLAVSVANQRHLQRALDAWAKSRFLRFRTDKKLPAPAGWRSQNGIVSVFARAEGTPPAAGYAISGEHAVILLGPQGSVDELERALHSIETASSSRPAVEAPLIAHFNVRPWMRDAWLGLTPHKEGLDTEGTFRTVTKELLASTSSHGSWLKEPVHPATGEEDAVALGWFRMLAGSESTMALSSLASTLLGVWPGNPMRASLHAAAPGRWEIVVPHLDLDAVKPPPAGLGPVNGQAFLVPTTLRLPDRDAAIQNKLLAETEMVLPDSQRMGVSSVFSNSQGKPVLVAASEDGLLIANTTSPAPSPSFGRNGVRTSDTSNDESEDSATEPSEGEDQLLSCPRGFPVASLRFEPALLARQIRSVGLFGSFGNPTLLGLFAIGNEYGALLRASSPLVALTCREPGERFRLQAKWRLPAAS